jgi:hypothetical protein
MPMHGYALWYHVNDSKGLSPTMLPFRKMIAGSMFSLPAKQILEDNINNGWVKKPTLITTRLDWWYMGKGE